MGCGASNLSAEHEDQVQNMKDVGVASAVHVKGEASQAAASQKGSSIALTSARIADIVSGSTQVYLAKHDGGGQAAAVRLALSLRGIAWQDLSAMPEVSDVDPVSWAIEFTFAIPFAVPSDQARNI